MRSGFAAPLLGVWRALALGAPLMACQEPYRVGELVVVEFGEQDCPGHIVDIRSRSRFRVHFTFEGHRWEEEVSLNRVVARGTGPVQTCHPPEHVAAALGISAAAKKDAEQRAAFKKGDKLKVRWRDSVYAATVSGVSAGGKLRVHYDGYEDAWDETISLDRVVTTRN